MVVPLTLAVVPSIIIASVVVASIVASRRQASPTPVASVVARVVIRLTRVVSLSSVGVVTVAPVVSVVVSRRPTATAVLFLCGQATLL
jgi:hypothetical protein